MRPVAEALNSLVPGAQWIVRGDEYSGIEWLSNDMTCPSESEVTAERVRLQQLYDAKDYQRKRAPEYPSIGDQLDALFHAGVFPAEMAAQIQAIKDKYPKGNQ